MASTFSNLGLNLQATGENSGTWGYITNVNLQDIDCAISGVYTITVTGNTTLAFTTNSSSTTYTNEAGRNKVIILNGSLSATTITITVPNIDKDYIIVNNSGGTATISSGGSTTVSVATGSKTYLYVDADTTSVSTAFTDQVNSPGGTSTNIQYNSSGAFAGSTNLTFDGTTVSAVNVSASGTVYAANHVGTTVSVSGNITGSTVFATNVTATGTVYGANLVGTTVTVSGNITGSTVFATNLTVSGTATATNLVATNATVTTDNITNLNVIGNGTLKLYNTANTFYTGLKVAAGASATATFTLPSADGTNGQAIITNGSGTLSFGNAGITAGKSIALTLVFG